MMKSFFKKLAFVMALAMVVSMAAPAGTAAFAADFYIADEADKKAETYTLAIGEKEDFKFKGAPSDWKNYKWTWVSSNTNVAACEAATGVVTGKADGVATITLTGALNGAVKYTATSKITVGKGEVTTSAYDVVLTTNETIEVRFEGKTSYKLADVVLYYLLENEGTTEDVEWPINVDPEKTYVAKDGTFVITPYVPFENGNSYRIVMGAKDEGTTFTTEFGLPDSVDLSIYESNKVKYHAYAVNDEKSDVSTEFKVRLFSGDVDVTSLYHPDVNPNASLEFEMFYTDGDASDVDVDSTTGAIVYQQAGIGVSVMASFSYNDGIEEAVATGYSDVIVSENLTPYKLKTVYKWTIVKDDPESSDKVTIDWDKVDHDLAAYDDEFLGDKENKVYKIVALISDSYGNYIVTDDKYDTDPEDNIYGPSAEYIFYDKGYTFGFESANVEKLLTDNSGVLITHTKANVPVLVSLEDTDGNSRYIGAVKVKVNEARTISKIVAGSSKVNLVTAGESDFYTEKVEVKVYDQHGDLWGEDANIAISFNSKGADITQGIGKIIDGAVDTTAANATNSIVYKAADGKATLVLNGSTLYANSTNKGSVKYTLTVKDPETSAEKACQVTVSFKKVSVKNDGSGDLNYGKSVVSASNVNQTVTTVNKIPAKNEIVFAKTSNNQLVGLDNTVKEIIYAGTKVNRTTGAATGDVYLEVVNKATQAGLPESKVVGNDRVVGDVNKNGVADTNEADINDRTIGIYGETDGEGKYTGKFHVVAAALKPTYDADKAIDGVTEDIEYLPTGTYTVTVKKISKFDAEGNPSWTKISNTTFTISNDNKEVTYVGLTDKKDVAESSTLSEIIVGNLDFHLGGIDWEFTADDISSVSYITNEEAGYVVITSVTFNVPLTGGEGADRVGYVQKVVVNKAIELPADDTELNDDINNQ